jgi:hypothetical protein
MVLGLLDHYGAHRHILLAKVSATAGTAPSATDASLSIATSANPINSIDFGRRSAYCAWEFDLFHLATSLVQKNEGLAAVRNGKTLPEVHSPSLTVAASLLALCADPDHFLASD